MRYDENTEYLELDQKEVLAQSIADVCTILNNLNTKTYAEFYVTAKGKDSVDDFEFILDSQELMLAIDGLKRQLTSRLKELEANYRLIG